MARASNEILKIVKKKIVKIMRGLTSYKVALGIFVICLKITTYLATGSQLYAYLNKNISCCYVRRVSNYLRVHDVCRMSGRQVILRFVFCLEF